jgi:hypothetical protein
MESTWWEVELQLQAAMCDPDDPEDVPGQTILVIKIYV